MIWASNIKQKLMKFLTNVSGDDQETWKKYILIISLIVQRKQKFDVARKAQDFFVRLQTKLEVNS